MPERDADDERDDERVEDELEGRGAVRDEDLGDRPVVGEGRAEVAR